MAGIPWFYAPPRAWSAHEVALPPDESRHALKVLRVASSDPVVVIDGCGTVARCAAARVDGDVLVSRILTRDVHARPRPEIAVYQGAARGHKLDDVVERLGELGVAELSAYESARAVARWDGDKAERRAARWNAIARSAAKVSRSGFALHARAGLSWDDVVACVAREAAAIVLWEEATSPLRDALVGAPERVALVVGPEGGLARAEASALEGAGARLVSLGPRVLRTENAAVVAASAVLFHYGVIG
ncbi:MAG TPA: RsmE family RNA methyltransferase [Actinomycetota bacterium]|nr:RsmE family RNA methyltransferase [Actinomycetota bacterium]